MAGDDQKWHWAEGTKYAIEATKGLLLINGGAAVALLAFWQKSSANTLNAHYIGNALLAFGLGAFFSVVLFFFAYVTQLQYGNDNWKKATRWHCIAYCALAVSALAFLVGLFCARQAIFARAV
jgi:hypothetical protein